ncbi:ABC transporter ATP-binding protein [Roseibium alexandrii]|uniref:ABC-type multidrug transport system, ATPase component n=1 Tax=Roseibium alexandrii (strain DSM 17067 / NCIMB 14079 / DFL-11) TaxID=244592 RepID=A0A5E8GU83_ROSAD|nr:ABC transporter ATP-binding protein [Roseibium alexandrii]EEE43498.1 ABC-type multidrug transport system, ATPase component [Roseibium alexandrii DFL-11]
MSDIVIQAEGLVKSFKGFRAVDGLDLTIERGMIYGFLGPNGCGKTTAIRMLTGLLTPTQGSVEVLGLSVPKDAEALKYKIGYMTQAFSLYGDLTVLENLNFMGTVYGLTRAQRKERIAEVMDRYELTQLGDRFAGKMSGGQRQRLALAAAVLHGPQLLFLDEPTSAVDPESRRHFWEQLFDLVDEGTSIVVTTHFMDEAERCHKIAIMEAGQKRLDGTPGALMSAMGANVVEIEAPNLRDIRRHLLGTEGIVTAAQLGARLRVLVKDTIPDPEGFLKSNPQTASATIVEQVRPNLEDVFVTATGEGRQ